MRRAIILALLFGGMQLLLPLGAAGPGGESLLAFGFLILVAYTTGELASAARLPRIIGYIAAGVLFGPSVLDTVTATAIEQLAPVSSLAISLIAFLAGAELRWGEVKERGRAILTILGTEMSFSFLCIVALLVALRNVIPFLHGTSGLAMVAFSVLFAVMASVHSPAVTMALLNETGASGPVARTTLGVVLVSDLVIVLLFSGALALAQSVVPPTGTDAPAVSLIAVVWEIGGAVIVGAVLGGGIALYLRFVRQELFLFAILVAFFGTEIARLAHTETLLTLLTAGFIAENVSHDEHSEALRHAMERSAAPVFVVFFALAGAHISIGDVAAVWMLVLPIAAVRIAAIWTGCRFGARWAGVRGEEGKYVWMGLVSQAGVAIGLVTVVADVYPSRGGELRALFLSVIAINETLGPILFRTALVRSGEIAESTPAAAGARQAAH